MRWLDEMFNCCFKIESLIGRVDGVQTAAKVAFSQGILSTYDWSVSMLQEGLMLNVHNCRQEVLKT